MKRDLKLARYAAFAALFLVLGFYLLTLASWSPWFSCRKLVLPCTWRQGAQFRVYLGPFRYFFRPKAGSLLGK